MWRRSAGIVGLTKSPAGKLGPDKIRVNAILLGMVLTERQKRLQIDDAAIAGGIERQCLKRSLVAADMVGPCSSRRRMHPPPSPHKRHRRWRHAVMTDPAPEPAYSRSTGEPPVSVSAHRQGWRRACRAPQRRRHDHRGAQSLLLEVLASHLAAIAAPQGLPVLICGMAGAKQGWPRPAISIRQQPLPTFRPRRARSRRRRGYPHPARPAGPARRPCARCDARRGNPASRCGQRPWRRRPPRLRARHAQQMGPPFRRQWFPAFPRS